METGRYFWTCLRLSLPLEKTTSQTHAVLTAISMLLAMSPAFPGLGDTWCRKQSTFPMATATVGTFHEKLSSHDELFPKPKWGPVLTWFGFRQLSLQESRILSSSYPCMETSFITPLGLVSHTANICRISPSFHILEVRKLYLAYFTNIKEISVYKKMLKLVK